MDELKAINILLKGSDILLGGKSLNDKQQTAYDKARVFVTELLKRIEQGYSMIPDSQKQVRRLGELALIWSKATQRLYSQKASLKREQKRFETIARMKREEYIVNEKSEHSEKAMDLIKSEALIQPEVKNNQEKGFDIQAKIIALDGWIEYCKAQAEDYNRKWTEYYNANKYEARDNSRQTRESMS